MARHTYFQKGLPMRFAGHWKSKNLNNKW
jgi:hypothetical protein